MKDFDFGVWDKAKKIQYICAVLHRMGTSDLALAPVFLNGHLSVRSSGTGSQQRTALVNLRRAGLKPHNIEAIRQLAIEFAERYPMGDFFRIDPDTLQFQVVPGALQRTLATRLLALDTSATDSIFDMAFASVQTQPWMVDSDHVKSIQIRPPDCQPPPPKSLPFPGVERQPLSFSRHELEHYARLMDGVDERDLEDDGSWTQRLRAIDFKRPSANGLENSEIITFNGLCHLIGLTGVGKSSLMKIICIIIALRGQRALVTVPSVRDARKFVEEVEFYTQQLADSDGHRVFAAVLSGQSLASRFRHSGQIAQEFAADADGGIALSLPAADDYGTTCVLRSFVANPNNRDFFPSRPPCTSIHCDDHRTATGHLFDLMCPVFTRCGFHRSARKLTNAQIWVGHFSALLSMAPIQTSGRRITYLEIAAQTFDLVMIDEADTVQAYLDGESLRSVTISGDKDSFMAEADRFVTTHESEQALQATGWTARVRRMGGHVAALRKHFDALPDDVKYALEMRILSVSGLLGRIIWELNRKTRLKMRRDRIETSSWRTVTAFVRRWDQIVVEMLNTPEQFDNQQDLPAQAHEAVTLPNDIVLTGRDIRDLYHAAKAVDDRADGVAFEAACGSWCRILRKLLPRYARVSSSTWDEAALPIIRVTLCASLIVLTHRWLSRNLEAMLTIRNESAVRNLLGPNRDVRTLAADPVVGMMGGVRFTRKGEGWHIQFVQHDLHMRNLLRDLPWIGTADVKPTASPMPVVLASATSWMPDSPSNHIESGPDIVLVRSTDSPGNVKIEFRPVRDSNGQAYFFSGAGLLREEERTRRIQDMAESLLREGTIQDRMGEGNVAGRAVAIVVNSFTQSLAVKQRLDLALPGIGANTMAVVNVLPEGAEAGHYTLPAAVEHLFPASGMNYLVLPMASVGRGVNIVRGQHAVIGQVIFLTRPHPTPQDTKFLAALLCRAGASFAAQNFTGAGPEEVAKSWREASLEARDDADLLLYGQSSWSRLNPRLRQQFAADHLVDILQMIGRGMRGGLDVFVRFVDGAWARQTAQDGEDNLTTSMLLHFEDILKNLVTAKDPVDAALAEALYGHFAQAFQALYGVEQK